ncbi:MAG: pretoxin, partial [Candidatus Thiodiazotropha endolucinida]|nr:pretoxin [Candidatus Thiodiazotropha taylori]MCW4301816.1 pretoxin [Candidatus Thiodiazotropha endolucinida]
PLHSVFNVDRKEVLGLVDEAWRSRDGPGTLGTNGNRVWTIDMKRVIGTRGERSIRLVIKDGTLNVITAYPW